MKPFIYNLNETKVIALDGELDAHAVSELRGEFEALTESKQNLIIDLSKVHFVDSSGVGVIVFLYKRLLTLHLNLSLIGVNGQPAELFEMLHINRSINCYDTTYEYLRALPGIVINQDNSQAA